MGTAVLGLTTGAAAGLVMAVLVLRRTRSLAYRYADEREFVTPPRWWVVPVSVVLVAGLGWRFADRPVTLVVLGLLWAPLLLLAVIDQDVHRLPDRITKPLYPILAIALAVPALVEWDGGAYLRALTGAAVGFGVYFLLAIIGQGSLGWGDVKLAGVLGMALGWVSWVALVIGLLAGLFLGAAFGLVMVVLRRLTRKDFIPLGPFLIVGAVATLVVAP